MMLFPFNVMVWRSRSITNCPGPTEPFSVMVCVPLDHAGFWTACDSVARISTCGGWLPFTWNGVPHALLFSAVPVKNGS